MEDVDCLELVDVLGVVPIGDIVARPFYEVLEFSVSEFGICNGRDRVRALRSVPGSSWYRMAGACKRGSSSGWGFREPADVGRGFGFGRLSGSHRGVVMVQFRKRFGFPQVARITCPVCAADLDCCLYNKEVE